MNHRLALYDEQHYLDTEYGGSKTGERINSLSFEKLVVSVRFSCWQGPGTIRLTLRGTNNDRDAPDPGAVLVPCTLSAPATLEDGEVRLTDAKGIVVACWRDLPKWCVVQVDCNNGIGGLGSELRACVIGV